MIYPYHLYRGNMLKKLFDYFKHQIIYRYEIFHIRIINKIGYGGSGVTKEMRNYIYANILRNSIVVELGAGFVSTRFLRNRYVLWSVEEDARYIGIWKDVNYIYAPIDSKTNWYKIKGEQLPSDFSLLLIDGPSGSERRKNILSCPWILNTPKTIIVDDTWRDSEMLLAKDLHVLLGGTLICFENFSVIEKH
jgi:hypothetical protein